jgi:hypothetical protein
MPLELVTATQQKPLKRNAKADNNVPIKLTMANRGSANSHVGTDTLGCQAFNRKTFKV